MGQLIQLWRNGTAQTPVEEWHSSDSRGGMGQLRQPWRNGTAQTAVEEWNSSDSRGGMGQSPAGTRGEKGDRGEKGAKGDRGIAGSKGEAGSAFAGSGSSETGQKGEKGVKVSAPFILWAALALGTKVTKVIVGSQDLKGLLEPQDLEQRWPGSGMAL
uniref:Uncharacterized protein n=1 Tax=Knipowitschia caucasica TaxID=637954 RepID=A0AAV2LDM5_KNICA